MSRKLKRQNTLAPVRRCLSCGAPARVRYCSARCRLKAYRARERTDADSRRCGHCSIPLPASRKLSAIYCGDACRQAAYRGQATIPRREAHQAREHGPHNLTGYRVEPISNPVAREFILEHEWLGTMPSSPMACYGMVTPSGALTGVAVFGRGSQPMIAEFGPDAVALERGAILHGEPRNAGSFLIARAIRLAHLAYGWRTFVAWADVRAGETGAIYRAAGWTEKPSSGGTDRTEYRRPDGQAVSERAARRFASGLGVTIAALVDSGWRRELVPRKRRFVRRLSKPNPRLKLSGCKQEA